MSGGRGGGGGGGKGGGGEGHKDGWNEGCRTGFEEGHEMGKREEQKNVVLLYDRWKDTPKHFDKDGQVILERPLFSKGGRGKVHEFPLSLYTLA